jgi:DNA-binding PadR family transcriptional regulator
MAEGPVCVYGLRVIAMTGLPSGTVYPAMRRLEREGLIQSHWERQSIADAGQRPLRKYYKLTRPGKHQLRGVTEGSKSRPKTREKTARR